ncbi:MAG: FeoB-associated Cys-rich membrane protein [Ruminococcaceae bacterium]|nr:FeoB-associated Cys-rich membrane protein [Oscillospiraceae bacterium]
MIQFLAGNIGSVIALLAVAFIVFLSVRRIVKDRKAGIGACGHKCSECGHSCGCCKE